MSRLLVIASLLLSHHPPVQHNRTLRIGLGARFGLRLCARCCGEAIGLILCLTVLRILRPATSPWLLLGAFLLPLPAILDWSTQAMDWRESTNLLRIVTGAMFAGGCVLIGYLAAKGALVLFILSLGMLSLVGVLTLRALRGSGAIDRVLEPFEAYAEGLTAQASEGAAGQRRLATKREQEGISDNL